MPSHLTEEQQLKVMFYLGFFFTGESQAVMLEVSYRQLNNWKDMRTYMPRSRLKAIHQAIRKRVELLKRTNSKRNQLQAKLMRRLARSMIPGNVWPAGLKSSEVRRTIEEFVAEHGETIRIKELMECFYGQVVSRGTVYDLLKSLGATPVKRGVWALKKQPRRLTPVSRGAPEQAECHGLTSPDHLVRLSAQRRHT